MFCWRFAGGLYHITIDGNSTICGLSLTGRQYLKWNVSNLDHAPERRRPCLSCKGARDISPAPPGTGQTDKLFVPIFEKDGNRFIVGHPDFGGADENEAWEIGCGASLVECILWGARFTGKTLDATDNVIAVKTKLGGTSIAVISGPIFDDAPPAD